MSSKRDVKITTRYSAEEADWIQEQAAAAGIRSSTWLRMRTMAGKNPIFHDLVDVLLQGLSNKDDKAA